MDKKEKNDKSSQRLEENIKRAQELIKLKHARELSQNEELLRQVRNAFRQMLKNK